MDFLSEYENSHVYMKHVQNITLTGNTFKWGVNDDGGGTKSPDYDVVLKNGEACRYSYCVFTYCRFGIAYNNGMQAYQEYFLPTCVYDTSA